MLGVSRSVAITTEVSHAIPTLLTPAEVANVLRVTPRTIQRYARDGRLDRVKIGNRLSRYTAESVTRLIEPENELSPVTTPSSTPNEGIPGADAAP